MSEIAAKPLTVFQSGLTSAYTGFLTHFDLVFERLVQPLKEFDTGLGLAMLGAAVISSFSAWLISRPAEQRGPRHIFAESTWLPGIRLALTGSAIMLAVYFCYFRAPWYPANWRTGFMSGVHVVAATGSCLVFAGLVSLLAAALPRRFKPALAVLPVLVFGILSGFGNLVQRDYANSWTFQRNFWQAYARLCPDATDGTFVLVLDRNLPRSRYIDLFSWGSEILPGALFQYRNMPLIEDHTALGGPQASPRFITRPPAVILTAPELATSIRYENGRYSWKPTYYFMLPKTDDQQPITGNVIVLTCDSKGIWERHTGVMAVDGGTLPLRPLAEGERHLMPINKSPLAAIYGL